MAAQAAIGPSMGENGGVTVMGRDMDGNTTADVRYCDQLVEGDIFLGQAAFDFNPIQIFTHQGQQIHFHAQTAHANRRVCAAPAHISINTEGFDLAPLFQHQKAGMKVAGLSMITNLGAGLSAGPLSHEETLTGADEGYDDISGLLVSFIDGLSE